MVNRWFILSNCFWYNKNVFSCIVDTDHCSIKYDILYDRFEIIAHLQWFSYSWRRRSGEEISYLRCIKKIYATRLEILNIPYFKNKDIKLADIEKIVEDNIDLKQALIEKYGDELGKDLYLGKEDNIIEILVDRFSDTNNIIENLKRRFGNNNDFTRIKNNLSDCIITSY